MPDPALLDQAIEVITALRGEGAHVHSITNTVAQNFTANVLLASGATVSMTANPKEIESFMQHANALHVNLGTLDDERVEAINKAVVMAQEKAIPITLDPVMIHVSEQRRELAKTLMKFPQIIRGNQSEINALDAKLAGEVCLVKTGQVDEIRQGGKVVKVENGHALM
ncbi:MAG: hydroxyethylthiazole kinase, partial [Pseudomonadota bacterium]